MIGEGAGGGPLGGADSSSAAQGVRDRRGVVTNVTANGMLEIAFGGDDGVQLGQMLDLYRLQPNPKYLGRAKVRGVVPGKCVAEIQMAMKGTKVEVGDYATADLLPARGPQSGAGAGKGSASGLRNDQGGLEGKGGSPVKLDARTTAERFLAAAVKGDTAEVRAFLDPALPKGRVDALKGLSVAPTGTSTSGSGAGSASTTGTTGSARMASGVVLVQVDGPVAMAISEACTMSMPGAADARSARVVMLLKRASAGQLASGWFAGDWLVHDAQVKGPDAALTDVADFLNRHPASRPVDSPRPPPGNY
jgi:hypothetical protein